ncbi:MAG: hypothetical protein GKR88_18030 [Flavobacteriaceae bacterium]|nr:MAG: hypothetical protein GKR88_18030 [Flavobacteriaceae bacterium]
MNEFLKSPENSQKPTPKNKTTKDFQNHQTKVKQIKAAEQEQSVTDFLHENQIKNSEKNRQEINQLLEERQLFDENFSLEDLSQREIQRLRKNENLNKGENTLEKNINQAQTAENLIDEWKAEGFNNYEILQKLLKAHETGQVKLLVEKYQQFSQFFALLENNGFGSDTAIIITVINQSNLDVSSPRAFNQVVFAIFDDKNISEATKAKIGKHFNLKPIVTGADLQENLFTKQKQIREQEEQQKNLEKSLSILNEQTDLTKTRLKELKEAIRDEKNFEKKRKLEQQYDELEELLKRLEKDTQTQEKQKSELENKAISDTIFVRGVTANLRNGEIVLTIPKSETKVTVPSHFDSKDIAKVVNAHLMYDLFQNYGLESYLFYPSDFTGDYPTQATLERNNAFLHKLGVSYDGLILKNSEIMDLRKLFNDLMLPNIYYSNLTQKENATQRLQKLGLLANRELNYQKFTEKLLWTKQFGEPGLKNAT